jgi:outer membrane immunogenic protein
VIEPTYSSHGGLPLKNLKLALLGATFLVGASAVSGAYAADVYSRGGLKDTGPVDYAPAITWTGFYVGIHAGSTFNDEVAVDVDVLDLSLEGEADEQFVAGLHFGYNWQTARNFVLGIEGSVRFPSDSDDFGADYLASIRGRLGYAFDRTLIYGTGGVAFLGWDENTFDETTTGWVAGAGVEHKLRDNLSLGLEGLYYSFDDDFANGAIEVERDLWTIQARLTYHFGADRHSEPLK